MRLRSLCVELTVLHIVGVWGVKCLKPAVFQVSFVLEKKSIFKVFITELNLKISEALVET